RVIPEKNAEQVNVPLPVEVLALFSRYFSTMFYSTSYKDCGKEWMDMQMGFDKSILLSIVIATVHRYNTVISLGDWQESKSIL
ncbi:hypothetical protein PMAYCL1PPCAC_13758, partial [Pristionchus mayeri]